MKTITILIFMTLTWAGGICQKIDTASILFTSKIKCLESGVYDSNEMFNISSKFDAQFIVQKGLNSFHFILIQKRQTSFDEIPEGTFVLNDNDSIEMDLQILNENSSEHRRNLIIGDCDYILAYSKKSNLFYKLKGFYINDFDLFLNEVGSLNSKYKKRKYFLNQVEIEGLDLKCLIRSKSRKPKNSDCLRSCYKRDLEAFIFR